MRWLGTIGPVLTLADAAAVVAAGLVATDDSPATLVVATGLAVLIARAADLHRPRLVLSIVEDLPGLFVAAAAATAVLVGFGSTGLAFCVLALACLVLAHTLVYGGTHVLRRGGRLGRPAVIVGTGTTARRLAQTLLARPELGLRPVGFVGTGSASALDQARGLPLALLGPVSGLPRSMTETHVDVVVVALAGPAGDEETAAVEGLLATPADVYAVPAWFPPVQARARHPRELVDGIPVVHLHRRGTWPPVQAFKRVVECSSPSSRCWPCSPSSRCWRSWSRSRRWGPGPRPSDRRARPFGDRAEVPHPAGAVGGPPGDDVLGHGLGSDRAGRTDAAPHPTRRAAARWCWRCCAGFGTQAASPRHPSAPAPSADQPQVDAGQLTR